MSNTAIGYFCPVCKGMELVIHRDVIVADPEAFCPLCYWRGHMSEVIGALAPSNAEWWTPERVAEVLLKGVSRFAAGPCVQLLEFVGLVPKIEGSDEEQMSARNIRGEVIKAVLEAVITTAFETAGALTPEHMRKFHPELMPAVEKAFGAEHADA